MFDPKNKLAAQALSAGYAADQVIENLDLTGGEVVCHGLLNSVLENKLAVGDCGVKDLFRKLS